MQYMIKFYYIVSIIESRKNYRAILRHQYGGPQVSRQNSFPQGKTFFLKIKLSFRSKTKLSFSRQNFLSQYKTFFLKTKLSFPRQNFLSQGKTFFLRPNFLSQGKTFFLKAKLSFSRQNFLSQGKTFSPRQNSFRREPKRNQFNQVKEPCPPDSSGIQWRI